MREEVHYVYGIVSTKMRMRAKNLRLYTNLMDEVHLAWLKREWRELQTQQRQGNLILFVFIIVNTVTPLSLLHAKHANIAFLLLFSSFFT